MKNIINYRHLLSFAILVSILIFGSCQREYLNPYDRECPAEVWTPENLELELIDDGVALSWDMDETHFDGFMIEMSLQGSDWEPINEKPLSSRKREYEHEIHNPDASISYRICAIADKNESVFCQSEEITLPSDPPVLETYCPDNIDLYRATLNGEITSDGGGKISERGFCYSKFSKPDIGDETIVVSGTQIGQYAITYSNFELGQTYYVKAYAINSGGVGYGEQVRFTTKSMSPAIWTILAAYMPVYSGDTPPDIEGTYLMDPFETVYTSDGDYYPGEILDGVMNFGFTKSNDCNNTYYYTEGSYSAYDVYVDGSGNNFVAYFTTSGTNSEYNVDVKMATIISGVMTSNGIQDFYYGIYMVEKSSDPGHHIMDVGTYRIYKDGNGMADYTTGSQSAFKEGNVSLDYLRNKNKLNEK